MTRHKERTRSKRPRTRKRGRGGAWRQFHVQRRDATAAHDASNDATLDGTVIPSVAEIRTLPLWMMVAFAAKCARQVQPLFEVFWPAAPQKYRFAVERAVELATMSAANATSYVNEASEAAEAAKYAAKAAEAADTGIDVANSAFAAHVARAAAYAAHAADAANEGNSDNVAKLANACLRAAANAAGAAAKADNSPAFINEFLSQVRHSLRDIKSQAADLVKEYDALAADAAVTSLAATPFSEGTLILRPTGPGKNKQDAHWVLKGPWGQKEYAPMSRVQLYDVLRKELIDSGLLPADAPLPSNKYHDHVTGLIMTSSWLDGHWVKARPA